MGNNKSSVDFELLYHLYLLRVHPYDIDRAYSTLIGVECKLLINIVTPHPPPRWRMGAPHGTGTPLPDFMILVGPFRNINSNLHILT